jgi:hypothetical protein
MEQLDSPLAVERPSERSEAGWGGLGWHKGPGFLLTQQYQTGALHLAKILTFSKKFRELAS